MRTGIFVYESTTLTIQGSEQLNITAWDGTTRPVPDGGQMEVSAGIYKVISGSEVKVEMGPGKVAVITTLDDKDPWPSVMLAVETAFSVQTSGLQSFFTVPGAKALTF